MPDDPDHDRAIAAAEAIGLILPDACVAEVAAALALLDEHGAIVADALARHPEA